MLRRRDWLLRDRFDVATNPNLISNMEGFSDKFRPKNPSASSSRSHSDPALSQSLLHNIIPCKSFQRLPNQTCVFARLACSQVCATRNVQIPFYRGAPGTPSQHSQWLGQAQASLEGYLQGHCPPGHGQQHLPAPPGELPGWPWCPGPS